MRKFTKKRAVVALSAVVALAFAAVAFAYLSASGSGSGTGSVSATASTATLAVTQAGPFTKLGDSEQATVTATNNGTSPQKVTIASLSVAPTSSGCPAGSFVLGTITSTPQEIGPGASAVIATAPVTFTDTPSLDQNGCLGPDTATYTASSN
jgi:hypothetical protein